MKMNGIASRITPARGSRRSTRKSFFANVHITVALCVPPPSEPDA